MQDACHINFVIDLAHRGVSVAQWLEHRSAEYEDLRFNSSWGLRIFSLSRARNKTKTSFSVYQLHFLLQRYYLVGLAVVSYPVGRDVSYATSDVCSHARGWGISNKCKDRSAVWARTDSNLITNRLYMCTKRLSTKRPDTVTFYLPSVSSRLLISIFLI